MSNNWLVNVEHTKSMSDEKFNRGFDLQELNNRMHMMYLYSSYDRKYDSNSSDKLQNLSKITFYDINDEKYYISSVLVNGEKVFGSINLKTIVTDVPIEISADHIHDESIGIFIPKNGEVTFTEHIPLMSMPRYLKIAKLKPSNKPLEFKGFVENWKNPSKVVIVYMRRNCLLAFYDGCYVNLVTYNYTSPRCNSISYNTCRFFKRFVKRVWFRPIKKALRQMGMVEDIIWLVAKYLGVICYGCV